LKIERKSKTHAEAETHDAIVCRSRDQDGGRKTSPGPGASRQCGEYRETFFILSVTHQNLLNLQARRVSGASDDYHAEKPYWSATDWSQAVFADRVVRVPTAFYMYRLDDALISNICQIVLYDVGPSRSARYHLPSRSASGRVCNQG